MRHAMEATPTSEGEERLAAAEAALEETLPERNRLWEQLKRQGNSGLSRLAAGLDGLRQR